MVNHSSTEVRLFEMTRLAIAVTFLLVAVGLTAGQLDCSTLNVERSEPAPISGTDLNVCRATGDQCCAQQFLDRIGRDVRTAVLRGLQDEMGNRMTEVQGILEQLAAYFFGNDFIGVIQSNIPLSNFLSSSISTITMNIQQRLNRLTFAISAENPEFNTTQLFTDLTDRVIDTIRRLPIPQTQKDCIVQQLTQHINQSSIRLLGEIFETVRRSFTAVTRIANFLLNFKSNLANSTMRRFPDQCVTRLIELSFCSRCKRRVPPLCSNMCGAVIRGCYSAFYSGLRSEFNRLWDVSKQVVNVVSRAVRRISAGEQDLLTKNPLTIASECGLGSLFGKRKRRQTSTPDIPQEIKNRVNRLTGVFEYLSTGPIFCNVKSLEESLCAGTGNPTPTPLQRSCDSNKVCTSACRCWNGQDMSMSNTMLFTGAGIEDQENNPAISIPRGELEMLAGQQSSPVSEFLTASAFTAITPEGVVIPGGSGGQATVLFSVGVMLISVFFAFM